MNMLFKIKIFLIRLICYEKPLRVAIVRYFSLKFKFFRPHYESALYEISKEAKRLGINQISAIELGVAGGNGLVSLEKYAKKISKTTGITIKTYGFDFGEGLPPTQNVYDLPFYWKVGIFKSNEDFLSKKCNSKIYYGDIKDTAKVFFNEVEAPIAFVSVDLDFYSSTKSFLDLISINKNKFLPRSYFYFDDLFSPENYNYEFNGEMKAIKEFNKSHKSIKLGSSIDHIHNFKFPLCKSSIFTLHVFDNDKYLNYVGFDDEDTLEFGSSKVRKGLF